MNWVMELYNVDNNSIDELKSGLKRKVLSEEDLLVFQKEYLAILSTEFQTRTDKAFSESGSSLQAMDIEESSDVTLISRAIGDLLGPEQRHIHGDKKILDAFEPHEFQMYNSIFSEKHKTGKTYSVEKLCQWNQERAVIILRVKYVLYRLACFNSELAEDIKSKFEIYFKMLLQNIYAKMSITIANSELMDESAKKYLLKIGGPTERLQKIVRSGKQKGKSKLVCS